MKKRNQLSGLMILPIVISIMSAYYKSLWLISVSVVSMFALVGIIPVCRKHENLWMFVLTAFCSIPINWFLLTYFDVWKDYLYSGSGNITAKIVIVEYMIVLMGVEENVIGLITRIIWKRQYKLYIPVEGEEE